MGANDMTAERLADAVGVHYNTVRNDLKDPGRIPMDRVWLYFAALDVPAADALQSFADKFSRSLVMI